jgi:MSHA biogenesis protein MshE
MKLGEYLIQEGMITEEQLNEALAKQSAGEQKKLGVVLLEMGFLNEKELIAAIKTINKNE